MRLSFVFYIYDFLRNVSRVVSKLISISVSSYTEILEVNLFAFAYRLFHEDFSPLNITLLLNILPSLCTLIWWGFFMGSPDVSCPSLN